MTARTTRLAALVVGWLTDWTIDSFGHKTVGYDRSGHRIASRTWKTHTIVTAPLVGVTVGLLIFAFYSSFSWIAGTATGLISSATYGVVKSLTSAVSFYGSSVAPSAIVVPSLPVVPHLLLASLLGGVVASICHLAADTITGKGIYKYDFSKRAVCAVGTSRTGIQQSVPERRADSDRVLHALLRSVSWNPAGTSCGSLTAL